MISRAIRSLLSSRKIRWTILFALFLMTLFVAIVRPRSLYALITNRFEPTGCDISRDHITSSISAHILGEDMLFMRDTCQNVMVVFSGFYQNVNRTDGNPAYRLFFSDENGEVRGITICEGCVYDRGIKYQIVKSYDLFLEEIERYFTLS